MREILFRGKSAHTGEWVEGLLLSIDLDTYSKVEKEKYTHIIAEPKAEFYRGEMSSFEFVVPETVGQYTGLKDRNGTKIFEGDILKVKHGILGREEEKPKMPRNAYGLHYEENERGMYGRWFYYRNYAVEYKAHGNSRGKYIVRNGSDQCDFTHSLFYNHDAEIIGNIHDNPDLITN